MSRPRCLGKSYQGHFAEQCNYSHRCENNDHDTPIATKKFEFTTAAILSTGLAWQAYTLN